MSDLRELWRDWWSDDIWIAPWEKAVKGLTPEQAAWKPECGRHSIWQLVNHVVYWRDVTMRRLAGEQPEGREPSHEEQFPEPARVDVESWDAAVERLRETHDALRAALEDESNPTERTRYHLAHDAYHLGQIMQLRAMMGMSPVL